MIDGDHYWDGGIVSNSPLWYVLDDAPGLSALIMQVDLFSARGALPQTIDEVLERTKDIQYSSKTRFNTNRVEELESMRAALGRLLDKLPPRMREDPDVVVLAPLCRRRHKITIMHLINRRTAYSSSDKDYLFSRAEVRELWQAGLEDVRRSCAHPQWRNATETVHGIRVFDFG